MVTNQSITGRKPYVCASCPRKMEMMAASAPCTNEKSSANAVPRYCGSTTLETIGSTAPEKPIDPNNPNTSQMTYSAAWLVPQSTCIARKLITANATDRKSVV